MESIPILQKVMDRGASDDFIARLLFGILAIRDHIYSGKEREVFDKFYTPIYQSLLEAEYSKEQVKTLLQKHISEVESGIKSEIKPGQVNINDNIQLELNLYFKDFFIRGGIALSYLVKFASFLGYNISFIYQKDRDFETGIKKFLEKHNSPLMEFLVDRVRTERVHWYTTFRKTRNDIEHEGWNLPNIKYSLENGQIKVLVPKFTDTLSINEGVDFLWIKLMEFCEEMVVMLISTKLPPHFAIVHLPKEKRDLKNPVRYQVVLALNGLPQI